MEPARQSDLIFASSLGAFNVPQDESMLVQAPLPPLDTEAWIRGHPPSNLDAVHSSDFLHFREQCLSPSAKPSTLSTLLFTAQWTTLPRKTLASLSRNAKKLKCVAAGCPFHVPTIQTQKGLYKLSHFTKGKTAWEFYKTHTVVDHVFRKYGAKVSYQTAHKALEALRNESAEAQCEQFKFFPEYLRELQSADTEAVVELSITADNRFSKEFVCMGTARKAFIYCRKFVAVDGTFKKNRHVQVLMMRLSPFIHFCFALQTSII
ncbi:hypothetical protein PsorP6_018166 [Peronosclerospora sorghi]|uniref:Uncharacterized protein n=1 Tax=Peronosclerospora sorghi TaxID=230839 RepID=A0ACC0WDD0_9STRA|nr:hypothetical protein PsorP6_018166 [Peronosclerospora sorghi]